MKITDNAEANCVYYKAIENILILSYSPLRFEQAGENMGACLIVFCMIQGHCVAELS